MCGTAKGIAGCHLRTYIKNESVGDDIDLCYCIRSRTWTGLEPTNLFDDCSDIWKMWPISKSGVSVPPYNFVKLSMSLNLNVRVENHCVEEIGQGGAGLDRLRSPINGHNRRREYNKCGPQFQQQQHWWRYKIITSFRDIGWTYAIEPATQACSTLVKPPVPFLDARLTQRLDLWCSSCT